MGAEKEEAVEKAGKEFEGGSIYPLIVNTEAAKITEERVYQLYEILHLGEGIGQAIPLSDGEMEYLEAQTTNTWLEMSDMEKSDFLKFSENHLSFENKRRIIFA